MAEPRLTTEFWVAALLRRLAGDGHFATVLAKGDAVSGALIVCSRSADGAHRLYAPTTTAAGARAWIETRSQAIGDTDAVAALHLARQRDPDLWWIEAETDQLATYLDGPIIPATPSKG